MIQNIIHQKIITYVVKNNVFLWLWGFKMQMKMCFMVLEIWSFDLEKALEIFLEEFVQTLFLLERMLAFEQQFHVTALLIYLQK